MWGQIVDSSTLVTEEDRQALGMILLLDLLGQECSLQRTDQAQATCTHSSLGLIRLVAKEVALVILSEAAEVDSMIHLVDQEEEEAASAVQAEAAWAVDSVVLLEEASVEAVASEVVVDLVALAETYLETIIIIIDLNKTIQNFRINYFIE